MNYKILDVINRQSNETADKFNVIGLEVTAVVPLAINRSAVLSLPDGEILRTSTVQEIAVDDKTIRVTTLNTIYVLQLINEEDEVIIHE